MTEYEAREILGVTEKTPWQEVLKASFSISIFSAPLICLVISFLKNHSLPLSNKCRNMTLYLRRTRRAGAFTFSPRFTGLRNT